MQSRLRGRLHIHVRCLWSRVSREAAHGSHGGPRSLLSHRCIRRIWIFRERESLVCFLARNPSAHFPPPTFLLIRIQYLPARSAALPGVMAMVLNGPCREGSAVGAHEPGRRRRAQLHGGGGWGGGDGWWRGGSGPGSEQEREGKGKQQARVLSGGHLHGAAAASTPAWKDCSNREQDV